MRQTINDIHAIRLTEQMYNVELFQPGDTTVTELSEEGITTYYTEYKSRKKHDVVKTPVDRQEMTAFFKEVYKFIRNADESSTPIDDCSYKLTLYYNSYHKEILEGDTSCGDEYLLGKIYRFVEVHRGQ